MITVEEADGLIFEHVQRNPSRSLPLDQLFGRVLAEDVAATRDQPPFNRVAMDGIALRREVLDGTPKSIAVAGLCRAGQPQGELTDAASCLEVMTGAPLPTGADCVIPYEQIEIEQQRATVVSEPLKELHNVHPKGADYRAGDTLLASGTRLRSPELAVIASQGVTHAQVVAPPQIAFVSTGDELVAPGESVQPHQIYRSNGIACAAELAGAGLGQVTQVHLPDDQDELRSHLARLLEQNDCVVLSGGVSMGKFDFVPAVLGELGVRQVFHKVKQRPGKPLWFGVAPGNKLVFGLPGNPMSALVGLRRYVVPALSRAVGVASVPTHLELAAPFKAKRALTHFVPVRVTERGAEPVTHQGSGDFYALHQSEGFLEVPVASPGMIEGGRFAFFAWADR